MRAGVRQRGFSLVEVLATTVVFSVGVLGISGLNGFSKRASYDAVQRSTAAELAYAILEEMRVNSQALAVYTGAGAIGGGAIGAEPVPRCDDPAFPCTPAQLAAHGLWGLEQMLDTGWESAGGAGTGGLVSPTACIVGPAAGAAGDYTVTLVWRGVTEMTDPAINVCGAGTGLYGAGDAFRRMVVVQSYIDPAL
jgi:type IV pilus assembly protein PilV